jgi:hypothetical protein
LLGKTGTGKFEAFIPKFHLYVNKCGWNVYHKQGAIKNEKKCGILLMLIGSFVQEGVGEGGEAPVSHLKGTMTLSLTTFSITTLSVATISVLLCANRHKRHSA